MPFTSAQKTTFKTNRNANTTTIQAKSPSTGDVLTSIQIKDVLDVGDNYAKIADWYNLDAAGPWVVWQDLDVEAVKDLITFANLTPLDAVPTTPTLTVQVWQARSDACSGKRQLLSILLGGATLLRLKRTATRAAFQDCLTNIPAGASGALLAANWTGVRDAAKRNASNVEKLFAPGTGTSATPADAAFEGDIFESDVRDALLVG